MSTEVQATPDDATVTNTIPNVRVSSMKKKYVYVDYTRHRLHEGQEEIVISGLASAISDAVGVVELLKAQGLVVVKRITTTMASVESTRSKLIDRIEIVVGKSPDFEEKYAAYEKERETKAQAAAK